MELEDLSTQRICFESFGVKIALLSSDPGLLERSLSIARKCLLGNIEIIENPENTGNYEFRIEKDASGTFFMFENGVRTNYGDVEFNFFKFYDAMLRLAIAERAKDQVFVHAGVVGWKGKAVVIPALSHTGKTTLVAALLSRGATYFSDEYAIIDRDGLVHPFPRPLSMRNWDEMHNVSEIPVAYFGGEVADRPARVGAVLLTVYEEGKVWNPEIISLGQGILESLPHAIPLRKDTELSMKLLNKAFENAIIAKCNRGDAEEASAAILDFLDKYLN